MATLPEGYVLDEQPKPPPGFVLDAAPDKSIIEKAKAGAQVGVASAAKGATEAIGVPAMILGMGGPNPSLTIRLADWARKQFGMDPIPEENKKEYERIAGSMRVEPEKGVKAAFERAGVSTDPEAEAKRLNVPFGGDTLAGQAIKAASQATRFGTSAALTGSGIVPTALSAVGAATGEAIGGETGAVVGSMATPLAALVRQGARAPTIAAKQAERDAAYAASEQAGVVISKNAFQRLAEEVNQDLAGRLGTGELHPLANASRKYLEDQASRGNVTLKGLDMVRQTIKGKLYDGNGKPLPIDKSDGALVQDIVDKIDDFILKLKPGSTPAGPATGLPGVYKGPDVIMGDAALGGKSLVEARRLHTQVAKAEKVQTLIDNADFYSKAFDLTMRDAFGRMARNDRWMRTFSSTERAAIERLAEGGSSLQQTLRFIGRAAPTRNSLALTLDVLGMGAGHYFNNPQALGAAVTMAIGAELAKRGSIGIARRNAKQIVDLMTLGYRPPPSIDLRALMPAIIQGYEQFSGSSADQAEPTK